MKKLFLLLIFVSTAGYSEKLIFSNNNQQVDITGNVTIDNQNGNVTVTTDGGDYLIVESNQPVILGFYPSDYEINSGENITVNWTVVNAESCTASTTSGSSSWSGNKSATNGNNFEANVSVSTLPSTLQITCSNTGNNIDNTVTKSFDISLQPTGGGGGSASIDTFTVNGQSSALTVFSDNNNASFTWSTTNVSSCTASSNPSLTNWSGSKATSGSQNVTITGSTVVTLTCDNLPPRNINITYQTSGNPNCSTSVYPPNTNKLEMTYAEANDGALFGTNTGATIEENINLSQFLALSDFYTDNVNYRRRIATFPAPTGPGNKPWLAISWSISECPGDFSETTATCTGALIPNQEIAISTRQSGEPSFYCIIQPGVRYYLNIIHDITPYDGSPGSCASSSDQFCTIFASEVAAAQR